MIKIKKNLLKKKKKKKKKNYNFFNPKNPIPPSIPV